MKEGHKPPRYLWTTHNKPTPIQSRHFFADSAQWGPSIVNFQAGNLRFLWLPWLEKSSLGASGGSLTVPRASTSRLFLACPARLLRISHTTKKCMHESPRTCQARVPDSDWGGDERYARCRPSPSAKIRDLRRRPKRLSAIIEDHSARAGRE